MTGLPQSEYQESFEVNKIKNSMLTAEIKRSRIQELRKSIHENPKNSSIATMFNITNCLVGSSIVVFPLVFTASGIMTSLIVLAFVGGITLKTCLLQVTHFKFGYEMDFTDIIRRILGKKWSYAYGACSSLLCFVMGIIYFSLVCNMVYLIMAFIFNHCGLAIGAKDEIVFDRFSYQYVGIIMASFCFIMFHLEDLSIILKIGQYGVVSIGLFLIFIIYKGAENISKGNVNLDNVKIITPDFATLCGVFSLSFMCHNVIIPVMRNNIQQTKNHRDISSAYMLTGFIYLIIGIFGCFAIAGLNPENKRYDTFLEYFSDEIFTIIIECFFFCQLLSVMPILWYVCRSQFFKLIYGDKQVPKTYFVLLNVINTLVILAIQMLNVDPTLIISLNGSVIGYLIAYVVPIKIHLKCLYGDEENVTYEQKKIQNEQIINVSNNNTPLIGKEKDKDSTFVHTFLDQDGVTVENYSPNDLKTESNSDLRKQNVCRSNHLGIKDRCNKKVRYVIYTTIMLIGLAFAVIKVVNLIMGK